MISESRRAGTISSDAASVGTVAGRVSVPTSVGSGSWGNEKGPTKVGPLTRLNQRRSHAEPSNRLLQNLNALIEFVHRHKFPRAMRDANVAGP